MTYYSKDKKNVENDWKMEENCQQFDPKKICFKVSNILMNKMYLDITHFNNLSWQRVTKYTKKGNSC